MKNKSLYERQYSNRPLFQSGLASNLSNQRANTSSMDFSLDKNIRRMSPAPQQDRYSQAPTAVVYQHPSYSSNDYQLPQRSDYLLASMKDQGRLLQDLLGRLDKLQGQANKWNKLQGRVERLEGNALRTEAKLGGFDLKRQDSMRGKQNIPGSENKIIQDDATAKLKMSVDLVTKEQLQKKLTGLDSTFKVLLTNFKSSINKDVGEYNMKNKKKFIELSATQLSQKQEQFKINFLKQWKSQVETMIKDTCRLEFLGKNVLGLSKQKFLGPAVPVKLRQELKLASEIDKELTVVETLYFVDQEGYLLDNAMYYLLDKNDKQIKLQESMLQVLRKEGLLGNVPKRDTYKSLTEPPLFKSWSSQDRISTQ